MKLQALRGMKDIGAPEIHLWHWIEATARRLYGATGFHEVRPPLLESTALFKRGVGEATDIVEKEMYTFEDRGGDSVSLRPEGTASVVRALIEHSWIQKNPLSKMYYFGPMYRYERPQKGRLRQHYQFGLEIFGVEGPRADVEIMVTQYKLFQELGIKDFQLHLSSIGCDTCRPPFRDKLVAALGERRSELCEDCQRRVEKNPLRVFDCKVEKCRQIAGTLPTMLENLCAPCIDHFEGVKEGLARLEVPFEVDPKVVRGIDYYTRTSFEFVSRNIGSQGTICGGGRYDKLVGELGGPETPAVGCGMGIERLVLLLQGEIEKHEPRADVVFVTPDPEAFDFVDPLAWALRQKGLYVETDLSGKSMKSQMKRADKLGARKVVIIGGNELAAKKAVVRNMGDKEQVEIPFPQLESELIKDLNN